MEPTKHTDPATWPVPSYAEASDVEAEAEFLSSEGRTVAPKMLLGLLAHVQALQAPKWISVNDRLPAPRPGGNVSWAVLAVEYTGSQVLVAYDYNAARWVGLDYAPRITHWQSLPANPVAVEGAESNG